MSRSGKKVTKFVTILNEQWPGLYEVSEPRYEVPNPDSEFSLKCPCCGKRLSPVFDVQQMGFWQDHYSTWFACRECKKAVEYIYDISRIEPIPRKHGKRIEGR